MRMSRRERIIAIVTAAVLGVLVLDRFVLTPWFEARTQLANQLETARAEAARAEQVFDNLRRANRRWADLAGDTLHSQAPAAEGQFLNALRDWADDSGLTLSAVRPDRGTSAHGFERITIRATGAGGMRQVSRFLWNLHTSAIPARLDEVQIATRQPGADELTLQLAVSTIYLPRSDAQSRSTP